MNEIIRHGHVEIFRKKRQLIGIIWSELAKLLEEDYSISFAYDQFIRMWEISSEDELLDNLFQDIYSYLLWDNKRKSAIIFARKISLFYKINANVVSWHKILLWFRIFNDLANEVYIKFTERITSYEKVKFVISVCSFMNNFVHFKWYFLESYNNWLSILDWYSVWYCDQLQEAWDINKRIELCDKMILFYTNIEDYKKQKYWTERRDYREPMSFSSWDYNVVSLKR